MLSAVCIPPELKLLFSTVGVMIFSLGGMNSVQASETVAYCESPLYAVNIYQDENSGSSTTSLRIRVFWREKSLVFADLPAQRSQFAFEGFTYSSQSGLSDEYANSLWTLFVPEAEGQPCLLFRNGTAFDSGDVIERQLE